MKRFNVLLLALLLFSQCTPVEKEMEEETQEDKYLWLEEVDGEKALEFVKNQSDATFAELSKEKDFEEIQKQSLEIYNSPDRIIYPIIYGDFVYNFWKDENNARGIWRRTSRADYMSGKPKWDTLLDIDELSKKDDVKWVFKGASGLHPTYDRFLVSLSAGGGDAVFVKEFDVNKKQFIEDGFKLDEAKGGADYYDENTLVVSTDFGEGAMTDSGYPGQVKIWKRGTDLKDAQRLHKGETTDVGTWGGVMRDGDKTYIMVSRAITFYTSNSFIWDGGKLTKMDIPDDASPSGILNNQLVVQLKSDWTVDGKTYKTGSLISLNFSELLEGKKNISLILEPDEFSSISQISTTKNKLLVNLLTNVTNKLFIYSYNDGAWSSKPVEAPDFGTISIVGTNDSDDSYFFDFENFITPSTLYAADADKNTSRPYKSLSAYFDADKYEVKQYKAKSKDGTMVPYFMVAAKGIEMSGTHPTLIYAYGGFEVSLSPFYASSYGVAWLEKGGVLVLANIRGGGEFGPEWHQNGIKEKRQNVYDDLFAVSEDLIAKKVTSPDHLGVMGGSNGGLLVGVAFTQRPDLYNAIVCQVPLLDMQRYNKLLAGASWMGEYGDPDKPGEWAYIKKYSPYHNVKEGMDYPEVYFYTSTRDDRVHPGHARKMVAKMNDMGYKTYYYENIEGGHAGSSTNEQRAKSNALTFSYLLKKLKG